jgi:hypothetical protein
MKTVFTATGQDMLEFYSPRCRASVVECGDGVRGVTAFPAAAQTNRRYTARRESASFIVALVRKTMQS